MGNRALIQFVVSTADGSEVSPAIYVHWSGSRVGETLVALRSQMADRPQDINYVAARCVARLVGDDKDSSTGFGLWNAPKRLTAEDSHGDAGVFIVDISAPRWHVVNIAGRPAETGPLPRATALIKFTRE